MHLSCVPFLRLFPKASIRFGDHVDPLFPVFSLAVENLMRNSSMQELGGCISMESRIITAAMSYVM